MTFRDDYDRVTSIIAPFAMLHLIPAHNLENARIRGSAIDKCLDMYLSGVDDYPIRPDWAPYVQSGKDWLKDKKIFKTKERLFDDENAYTGEFDCIREEADGLVVVDFKATASKGSTWGMQGAAYAHLARQYKKPIIGAEFVKLDKNGGKPTVYHYPAWADMDDFLDCLRLYRKFFKNKNRENADYL